MSNGYEYVRAEELKVGDMIVPPPRSGVFVEVYGFEAGDGGLTRIVCNGHTFSVAPPTRILRKVIG